MKKLTKKSHNLSKTLKCPCRSSQDWFCRNHVLALERSLCWSQSFPVVVSHCLVKCSLDLGIHAKNTESRDWLSLFASWTGIVCVILVAEGRASNYLLGLLTQLSI